MDKTVGMLWVGRPWTKLEQSAALSWIAHGYDVKLFTYENVENVPSAVKIEDARQVWDLNPKDIRKHVKMKSYAPFSDLFCYKMLAKFDGIVKAGPDQYCIKPLPTTEYIFGKHARNMIADAVLRIPATSVLMETITRIASEYENDYDMVAWGLTGPMLMKIAVNTCGLHDYALPERAFCPIDPKFKLFPFTNISGDDSLKEFDNDPSILGVQMYATGVLNSFGGDVSVFNEPLQNTLYSSLVERFLK